VCVCVCVRVCVCACVCVCVCVCVEPRRYMSHAMQALAARCERQRVRCRTFEVAVFVPAARQHALGQLRLELRLVPRLAE
jgi:hypothetical protein